MKKLALGALLSLGLVASAQANTVSIVSGGSSIATVTSSGSGVEFLGFISDGVLDNTAPYTATAYDLPNSGQATETSFIADLANTSVTFSLKNDNPNQDNFAITGTYFALKFSTYTAFFQNLLPGTLTLDFTGDHDLSHFSVWNGTPTAVPGPIAGAGLPALMALGGFVWARRRKAAGTALPA